MESCLNRIHEAGVGCKLRTFKLFKTEYRIEPYLLCTADIKIIHTIARFRLSSHNLCIETGRHARPVIPAHARYCKFCPSKTVEDEPHFLIACQMYERQRLKLFSVCRIYMDAFDSWPDICKFTQIMSNKEPAIQIALGKYLHASFKMRLELCDGSKV